MIHAVCVDAAPSEHAVEGALVYDSGASHHIVNGLKYIRDVRTSTVKPLVHCTTGRLSELSWVVENAMML